LSDGEVFFIDTSIPIYAAGRPSEHKEACTRILEMIEGTEIRAAIDTEVIQEILYRFHRLDMQKQGLDLSQNVLRLNPRILPVLKRDIEYALILFEKYSSSSSSFRKIPPRDVLHTAIMLNNSITKIITVDRHFGDAIKEVERVDPKSLV
jgi:predicted nucleic acid-binding protein